MTDPLDEKGLEAAAVALSGAPFPTNRSLAKAESAIRAYLSVAAERATSAPGHDLGELVVKLVQSAHSIAGQFGPNAYRHTPQYRAATILQSSDWKARAEPAEAALRDALEVVKLCQSTLAMMTQPDAIKNNSIPTAWAACVEAETRARQFLSHGGGE